MPFEKQTKKFITDSPKTNFFFGLVIGVAIVGLLGFGGLILTRDDSGSDSDKNPEVAGEQEETTAPNLEITDTDHVLGDKNAPVVIFEFSDFQCPYCAQHHSTLHQLVKDYEGKVAWVFKHFPLTSH